MAEKYRIFTSLLYLDSCNPDWLDLLDSWHIKAFVSPLHNMDKKDDGTLKKEHYHIMLMYDCPISPAHAQKDFHSLGCANDKFEIVKSKQGMARYLCHLDNKEKYQYCVGDTKEFGGANYTETIMLSEQITDDLCYILDFIDDNDLVSFADLLRYCRANNTQWLRLLLRNTATIIAIKEFQKSVLWEKQRDNKEVISDGGTVPF